MKTNYRWAFWGMLAAGLAGATLNAEETGVVQGNNVNVRGQASLAAEIVTRLKAGDTVTVLEEITVEKPKKGEPAKWYRIALPANTPVWVNSLFIDPTKKTVTPKRLNLRAGPGENFSILGRIEQGVEVKEIRQQQDWIEIAAPTNAYAFVVADLIAKKEPVPAPAPVPAVKPPVVAAPPAPPPVVPVAKQAPVAVPPPLVAAPPAETPLAAPDTKPPKRIVRREGIVKSTVSVQAPTYYELRSVANGKTINYLYTTSTNLFLKDFKGKRIFVTGEELLDQRWTNTPVLEIETIEIVP